MLLFQRSIIEGSLSLLLQCSKYADLVVVTTGEEKERYSLLLELLTPVAKTYPSEMGVLSTSQGLQCLGGYGYCEEFHSNSISGTRESIRSMRAQRGYRRSSCSPGT